MTPTAFESYMPVLDINLLVTLQLHNPTPYSLLCLSLSLSDVFTYTNTACVKTRNFRQLSNRTLYQHQHHPLFNNTRETLAHRPAAVTQFPSNT